jgi:hydrogenase nickel incorporation protein HypA/HybF
MHEMSVAQNVIDIVRQHVPPADEPRVSAVRVRLGGLSGVVADSLEFCFGAMVAGTLLAHACLEIEHVPTVCECRDCSTRFEPESWLFRCPSCASGRVRLVSGRDLQVVHVELNDAPDGKGARSEAGRTRPPSHDCHHD